MANCRNCEKPTNEPFCSMFCAATAYNTLLEVHQQDQKTAKKLETRVRNLQKVLDSLSIPSRQDVPFTEEEVQELQEDNAALKVKLARIQENLFPPRPTLPERLCLYCKTNFVPHHSAQHYCSSWCRQASAYLSRKEL